MRGSAAGETIGHPPGRGHPPLVLEGWEVPMLTRFRTWRRERRAKRRAKLVARGTVASRMNGRPKNLSHGPGGHG